MNKKVLWSMIILLWIFLISFTILKLFFGQEFIAVINNTKIIQVGNFIDEHAWAKIIVDTIVSSLIMHFYLCACKRSWSLDRKSYLCLVTYVLMLVFIYRLNNTIGMILDIGGMIVIPIIMKFSTKHWISVFILHQMGQIFTLCVRSEALYLANTDYATQFVLLFDVYVWLVLYYLYSNLYREESIWENLLSPFLAIREKLNTKRKSKE